MFVSEVPRFEDSLNNLTASLGREAVFTCVVNDLGAYRVSSLYLLFRNSVVPSDQWQRQHCSEQVS